MKPEERAVYESHIEAVRYQRSVIQTGMIEGRIEGRKEGEAIGLEKGEKIGLEKGEAIGLEKGVAIGLKKALAEVALTAARNGLPEDQIQAITGLTKEAIQEILKEQ
jgi:predicted transposase YdaD